MADFKIGDRVVCVKKYSDLSVGKIGVVGIIRSVDIGVVWENFNYGHDRVPGAGSSNGYNVAPQNLLKITRNPKKGELMLIKKSPIERIYIKEKNGTNFLLKFEKEECWVFGCDFRMSRSVILGVESILRGLDSCRD